MQSGTERAGIGIILALSPDSSLYVHTVCPGGSAEGSLLPGDVLLKIGQEDVYRYLFLDSDTKLLCWCKMYDHYA